MKWNVEMYETIEGACPVFEFLSTLQPKLQAKTLRTIDLLEEFGFSLNEPHSTKIKGSKYNGLYELRTKYGSDITRVFYMSCTGRTFILLHGFVKKTAKTPPRELEIARMRMLDCERRFLR